MVKTLQIGLTYIGTVVGAGFASGQEIMHFVTRFGEKSIPIVMICTILLMFTGGRIMTLSHQLKAQSYHEMNHFLFGKTLGNWINILTFLMLLFITGVMLAGSGAIFQPYGEIYRQLGIILTSVLVYIIVSRGMSGILMVNSFVVPTMILFNLLICVYTFYAKGFPTFPPPTGNHSWLASPFLYSSFNLSLALAVLVPLASESNQSRILWRGGLLGGLGLGLLLFLSNYALTAYFGEVAAAEIPMAQIVAHWNPFLSLFFNLVIFGEIFTTLVGNIFGLSKQMLSLYPHFSKKIPILSLILLSYVISQFGFARLIHFFYPIFGYISVGTFLLILLRPHASSP